MRWLAGALSTCNVARSLPRFCRLRPWNGSEIYTHKLHVLMLTKGAHRFVSALQQRYSPQVAMWHSHNSSVLSVLEIDRVAGLSGPRQTQGGGGLAGKTEPEGRGLSGQPTDSWVCLGPDRPATRSISCLQTDLHEKHYFSDQKMHLLAMVRSGHPRHSVD